MKAILYLSTLTEDLSRDELKEIQTKSAIKNKALGVSGYLYFDGAKFLQYIEGEEDTLMPLVKLIREDPRHTFLVETEEDIEEARFPEWSMKNIQSLTMELGLVEKTIIQTLSIFVDKGYGLDKGISRDLFKLMDHLKAVTF
jgi:hypothetical protein